MPYIESDFYINKAFDLDDISLLFMMYDTKNIKLKDKQITDSLRISDSERYNKLGTQQKARIDRISEAYLKISDEDGFFIKLNPLDTSFYNNLTIPEKNKTDRLIASRLRYFEDASKMQEKLVETLKTDELSLTDMTENKLIEKQETTAYERLISFMLSCHIYDIPLALNESDYLLSKKLSIDELSIMDMIYAVKKGSFRDALKLDSIKTADQIALGKITNGQNILITNLVESYLSSPDTVSFVKMNKNDISNYESLKIEEKFALDRLWVSILSKKIKEKEAVRIAEILISTDDFSKEIEQMTQNNELISKTDYDAYERILSFKLANYIHGIDVAFIESDFKTYSKMSLDDASIMEMMLEMRKKALQDTAVRNILKKADNDKYNQLSSENQKFIDRIVASYSNANISDTFIVIPAEDAKRYAEQSIESKIDFDRIIISRLNSLIYSPENYIESGEVTREALSSNIKEIVEEGGMISTTDFENYERLLSMKTACYIYSKEVPYIESDFKLHSALSDDDLSIVDLMFLSRTNVLSPDLMDNMKKSDRMMFNNLSEKDKQFVTVITNEFKDTDNSRYIRLPQDKAERYKSLTIIEKNRFDRLIVAGLDGFFEEQEYQFTNITSKQTQVIDFTFKTNPCKDLNFSAALNTTEKKGIQENIKISLYDNTGKEILFAYTDNRGNFKFSNVGFAENFSFIPDRSNLEKGLIYYIDNLSVKCNDSVSTIVNNVKQPDNITPVNTDEAMRPIENVFFDYNKYDLNTDAVNVLNRIIKYYKENKNCLIYLNAFTDNVGADEYNMHLSRQRARTVMFYLIDKGVQGKDIKAHAEGKENPSVPNSNLRSRAINRRVEIVVMKIE